MASSSDTARAPGPASRAGTQSEPILELEGFSLTFSPGAPVNLVEDVSFSVRRGETLCIVGESGCGKSVTALSLMGLCRHRPAGSSRGRVVFEGGTCSTLDRAGACGACAATSIGDDLPGADDLPQSGLHRRRPDRRGDPALIAACRKRGPGRGRRDAAAGADSRARAAPRRNTRTSSPAACASAS